MLCEESGSLSMTVGDVGDVPHVQMEIPLNDTKPVQKRYNTLHRPLYPEVKSYIQDLLNRNIITKSTLAYLSSIIAARRKNGRLRAVISENSTRGLFLTVIRCLRSKMH